MLKLLRLCGSVMLLMLLMSAVRIASFCAEGCMVCWFCMKLSKTMRGLKRLTLTCCGLK